MNPPFGTKNNDGVDVALLSAAIEVMKNYYLTFTLQASSGKVFSLHKESTSAYIVKYVRDHHGLEAELMHKIEFDLPSTYKFHKKSKNYWAFLIIFEIESAMTEVVLVKVDKSKEIKAAKWISI